MKNVKRFMPKYDWDQGRYLPMEANDDGDFVQFEDYESVLTEFSELRDELSQVKSTPVNPDATAGLVTALRAILDYDNAIIWKDFPDHLINDANDALRMAQVPVVPVSEDVEKDARLIRKHLYERSSAEELEVAFDALDRLAAAGRKG